MAVNGFIISDVAFSQTSKRYFLNYLHEELRHIKLKPWNY